MLELETWHLLTQHPGAYSLTAKRRETIHKTKPAQDGYPMHATQRYVTLLVDHSQLVEIGQYDHGIAMLRAAHCGTTGIGAPQQKLVITMPGNFHRPSGEVLATCGVERPPLVYHPTRYSVHDLPMLPAPQKQQTRAHM